VSAADAAAGGHAPSAPPGTLGAALMVAGAACCFGAISTLAVIATRPAAPGTAGVALETVLTWRYVVAGLVLAPLAAMATRRAATAGDAARWIPVATLGFLFYTFPAWVTLFAAVRGTERLDGVKLGALALSLAGIGCTVGLPAGSAANGGAAGSGPVWPGVALALAAAVVYALYIPFLGRLQARATPAGAAAWVCLGATLILGTGAVARGTFTAALGPVGWGAVAVLAVLCTVVAFIAFMRGLGRLGSVRSAIISTVEPFFTAVLGAVALGQPFGPATLVGGALIALAVLLLQRRPTAARIEPSGAPA
jgi:drug/metabolite transporter (DMT)-like permease